MNVLYKVCNNNSDKLGDTEKQIKRLQQKNDELTKQ